MPSGRDTANATRYGRGDSKRRAAELEGGARSLVRRFAEAVGQIAEKRLRAQRWAAGGRFPSQRGPRPTQRQLRWHSGAVVPRLIDALVSGPVFPTASVHSDSERRTRGVTVAKGNAH